MNLFLSECPIHIIDSLNRDLSINFFDEVHAIIAGYIVDHCISLQNKDHQTSRISAASSYEDSYSLLKKQIADLPKNKILEYLDRYYFDSTKEYVINQLKLAYKILIQVYSEPKDPSIDIINDKVFG